MKIFLSCFLVFLNLALVQGQTKKVLFLGNSYTYVNNLPQMVADMASSTGDVLSFDGNLIGSATFYDHSQNSVSISKISTGNWDYVVLQGQSLELWNNFPNIMEELPEVGVLDSLINYHNPCGETMFYMTWGRKFGMTGDSYLTMDSIIHGNYMKLADSVDAVVSPVGEVWKYIRQQHPSIELYDTDGSHPSLAGTYAAACSFYTAIFRKDPTLISFNSGLTAADALDIRNAAKLIVYDSLLNWHIGEYDSIMSVSCNTSVQSINMNLPIKIFPNPFSSETTLQSDTPFHNATLTLENCFGQNVMKKENISGQILSLSRDQLPPGLYFLRLTIDNKVFFSKVLITEN